MNRRLYSILAPIFILVIFACNIYNTPTPAAVALIPALALSVQAQNATNPSNTTGPVINYQYIVTNTGNVPLVGPVTVTDDKIMVTCPDVNTVGNLNNNLDPNETLNCTGVYTLTQADLNAGSVTNNATATIGGTNSTPATTQVNTAANIAAVPASTPQASPTASFVRGSTIQHRVEKGDWLIQIARCYGADYKATRRANPQIINPSVISINKIVTVPNIGSNGNMYGPPCVVYHTVQAGDSWNSIAQTYNADVTVLQAANRGTSLSAGKVLKVPRNSGGGTPQPPPGNQTLNVNIVGTGTVVGSPAGINCGSDCTESYPTNTIVTLTANPTAPATFGGWSGACSGTSPTCNVTMSAAQTVTATFNSPPGNQTLTVNKTGAGTGKVTGSPLGIDCGSDCAESYPINTAVTLTAAADPGSNFAGWSGGGCSGTGPCTVTMNAAQTVTATFNSAPGNQTLTVNKSGTGTVVSSPAGLDCGATCAFAFPFNTIVTLTANPTAPATFGGWSGACSGTSPTCNVTMNAAQTVTATFNPPPGNQTLIINKSGAGTGTVASSPAGIDCGPTCTFTFPFNATVTLTANPSSPSTFGGWSGGSCSGTGPCTVTMNAAQTVTATFNPPLGDQTLSINKSGAGTGTVASSPAGIDCGSDCSENYPINTNVILTANPTSPSTFGGWSGGGCSGTGICTVTMNAAQSVTALFNSPSGDQTLTVNITGGGAVTSSPAGINCLATCSAVFPSNTIVTLTAVPLPFLTFGGWSGACSGTGICTVTMNQAQTVTATFQ